MIAIPRFGFLPVERIALGLWLVSGAVSLAHAVSQSQVWYVVLSAVLLVGALGACLSILSLTAVGLAVGLALGSAGAPLLIFPTVWMLFLVVRRRRAFLELQPRVPLDRE